MLPKEALDDAESDKEKIENVAPFTGGTALSSDGDEGLPWFETMVKGSRLGNVRRSWGERRSQNGRFKVEWEIMEWTEDGSEGTTSLAKRKIGEVVEDDVMEGAH